MGAEVLEDEVLEREGVEGEGVEGEVVGNEVSEGEVSEGEVLEGEGLGAEVLDGTPRSDVTFAMSQSKPDATKRERLVENLRKHRQLVSIFR